MEKLTWEQKHNIIMKNKRDIIKKYNENISIKEIAKTYELSYSCIQRNLRLWGIRKKHGIRYLLGKCIEEM